MGGNVTAVNKKTGKAIDMKQNAELNKIEAKYKLKDLQNKDVI